MTETKRYPTPHIDAVPGDFAKTVLMPGDPLRSKFIAETYFENPVLVNNVRGVQGYTGTYHGTRVSVMASGMGMPSIGIYSYELFDIFGVENIIRVGSAGAIRRDVALRDIVIGMGACTTSSFADQYGLPGTFAPIADYTLLSSAVKAAENIGARYHVGNLLSSDVFYSDAGEKELHFADLGVYATEMEAAALYMNAARLHKRALAVCTVSDQLVLGGKLSALDRQESFDEMIRIALSVACEMGGKE